VPLSGTWLPWLVLAGAYLLLTAAVSVPAAGAVLAVLVFSFLTVCLTVLCLAACSAFGAAAVVAGAAAGVAVVPVCANTGKANAENRVATMMEDDFMAIFLKEK